MIQFETLWRNLIKQNTKTHIGETAKEAISAIETMDSVEYSRDVITTLRTLSIEDKIQKVFCNSACHMDHTNLASAKAVYQKTKSIEQARQSLETQFKQDIKAYKNLTDEQVTDIISKGWGAAGIMKEDSIIATKIPSAFHQYFQETDERKKKYYYCHCPRVKKELLDGADLDAIYCYCGGGFYQDIWEYITDKEVTITVLKSLFKGDDVCQFQIDIPT